MKKFIAALAAMFMVSTAMAAIDTNMVANAGFNKLSEADKAAVIKHIADKTANVKELPSPDTVDKVEKWVNVGANLGKGLAATAKELGVAVNEFATTPIGMLATMLIIWHLLGGAIVHIVGGILFFIAGIIIVRYGFKRMCPDKVVYDETKTNIFGNAKIKEISETKYSDGELGAYLLANAIVALLTGVIIFTF